MPETSRWGVVDIIIVYIGILLLGIGFGVFGEKIFICLIDLFGIENSGINFSIFGVFMQFITTVGLVLAWVIFVNKGSLKDLGINNAEFDKYLKYGLGGGVLLLILITALGWPINYLKPDLEPQYYEEMLRSVSSSLQFTLIFIAGVILAPLSEELFYRGMIYPVFRARMGKFWGAILAGLVFGLAHWDVWRAIPLAIGGAVLCYIYEKSGSIFVSALAHGTWNAVMSLIVYLSLF